MGGRHVSAPTITVVATGAIQVAVSMEKWGNDAGPRAKALVAHYGALLKADVQARAGRLFDVSDYVGNIHYQTSTGKLGWVRADIGTDEPQGYRLEFGFVGVDSRGRTYHQAASPHFGPALDRVALAFEAAMVELVP